MFSDGTVAPCLLVQHQAPARNGYERGYLRAFEELQQPEGPGCSCAPTHEVNKVLDFDLRVSLSPVLPDGNHDLLFVAVTADGKFGKPATLTLTTQADVPMGDLVISLTWDRISKPGTNAEGATPTPDDLKLITALTIDY